MTHRFELSDTAMRDSYSSVDSLPLYEYATRHAAGTSAEIGRRLLRHPMLKTLGYPLSVTSPTSAEAYTPVLQAALEAHEVSTGRTLDSELHRLSLQAVALPLFSHETGQVSTEAMRRALSDNAQLLDRYLDLVDDGSVDQTTLRNGLLDATIAQLVYRAHQNGDTNTLLLPATDEEGTSDSSTTRFTVYRQDAPEPLELVVAHETYAEQLNTPSRIQKHRRFFVAAKDILAGNTNEELYELAEDLYDAATSTLEATARITYASEALEQRLTASFAYLTHTRAA